MFTIRVCYLFFLCILACSNLINMHASSRSSKDENAQCYTLSSQLANSASSKKKKKKKNKAKKCIEAKENAESVAQFFKDEIGIVDYQTMLQRYEALDALSALILFNHQPQQRESQIYAIAYMSMRKFASGLVEIFKKQGIKQPEQFIAKVLGVYASMDLKKLKEQCSLQKMNTQNLQTIFIALRLKQVEFLLGYSSTTELIKALFQDINGVSSEDVDTQCTLQVAINQEFLGNVYNKQQLKHDSLELLKTILELKPEIFGKEDWYGIVPLFYMIQFNTHALLNACASSLDLKVKDNKGRTALMIAAQAASKEVFILLLQHKLSVRAQDNQGKSVLDYAILGGNTEIISMVQHQLKEIERLHVQKELERNKERETDDIKAADEKLKLEEEQNQQRLLEEQRNNKKNSKKLKLEKFQELMKKSWAHRKYVEQRKRWAFKSWRNFSKKEQEMEKKKYHEEITDLYNKHIAAGKIIIEKDPFKWFKFHRKNLNNFADSGKKLEELVPCEICRPLFKINGQKVIWPALFEKYK